MINLENTLNEYKIPFTQNQPMAQKTTFKIGSTADYFIAPENMEQFQQALALAKLSSLPFYILGGGSNTVFPDTPYKGIIISTENLKAISVKTFDSKTVYVTCQAGTPMATFVNFCLENHFSGIEQFAGLPGSVGGAVYMNARCFNKSINEIFYSAEYVAPDTPDSKITTMEYKESDWSYKKSPFQPAQGSGAAHLPHKYVLSATFCLTSLPEEEAESIKKMEEDCKHYISERRDKGHFKYPSAGSVFKNNHDFGKPSGQLIDEAGLRGKTIGGAQIAPFHGNFIINVKKATSKDVEKLVKVAEKTVKEKFGFDLEPEIIFLKEK